MQQQLDLLLKPPIPPPTISNNKLTSMVTTAREFGSVGRIADNYMYMYKKGLPVQSVRTVVDLDLDLPYALASY